MKRIIADLALLFSIGQLREHQFITFQPMSTCQYSHFTALDKGCW